MQTYPSRYPAYLIVLSVALILSVLDTWRIAIWREIVSQPIDWWFWFSVKAAFYGGLAIWLLALWYLYGRYGHQRIKRAGLGWRYVLAVMLLGILLPGVMGGVYYAWAAPGARSVALWLLYQDIWLHYGLNTLMIGSALAGLLWMLSRFFPLTTASPEQQPESITIKQRDQLIPVPVEQLEWVQSDGNYVTLHTFSGEYTARQNISRLADELAAKGFLRVHRTALVNRGCVTKLHRVSGQWRAVMRSGASVPVSRRRIQEIKAELNSETTDHHPSTAATNPVAGEHQQL